MTTNQQIWKQWKRHWAAVFNEKQDIHKLTKGGDFNNQSNCATKMRMGEQMVASLDKLTNEAVKKNDTVKKLVMSKNTPTEYIASLQAQSLNLMKLVRNLTAGPPAVATRVNPRKDQKPPWYPIGYCWYHGYTIHTGHNSETCTTRNPGHDTTAKGVDT